jgi:uncharacterized protein
MTPLHAVVVLVAGMLAGALTAVAGAGSLASFPALLAVGLSPVVANVSSAVGLVPGSVAGAFAYRHQLGPLRPLLVPLLVPAAVGGVVGAVALLVLPESVFSALLPALLTLAAVLVAVQPRIARAVVRRRIASPDVATAQPDIATAQPDIADNPDLPDVPIANRTTTARAGPVVVALAVVVAIYGGYFGAAVSVMYLALLGALIGGLQASNGVKNTLTALTCGMACLVFVLRADVDWAAAALLAVGSATGGVLGGRYGRNLPDVLLRVVVVVVALATAVAEATRQL